VRRRDVVAAILQRGAHPVAAFAHSGVGQTHGVEVVLVGFDPGAIDFHLNDIGVDAVDCGAEGLIEHGCAPARHPSSPPSAHQGLIPESS
jgi:hypothetical protein